MTLGDIKRSYLLGLALLTLGACADSSQETNLRGSVTGSQNKGDSRESVENNTAFGAAESVAAKPQYPSPQLVDPVKITIDSSRTGGNFPEKDVRYFAGTKEIWPEMIPIRANPGVMNQVADQLLHFPYWVDVEVTIQTPMTVSSTIRILGGRNVVVRSDGNGVINKPLNPNMPKECPANDLVCKEDLKEKIKNYETLNTVLALESQQLSVTVENLKINVNGDFTDGIGLRQNPFYYSNQPPSVQKGFRGVDVFIRNVVIDGVGGHYESTKHGDMVQLQSGTWRNLFFENFSGTTGYQGLFLPNRHRGVETLCAEEDKKSCGYDPTKKVFTPMIVTGAAYLKDVTLRPYKCAHCSRPYIGLYTADKEKGERQYDVYLHNVKFYRDPERRSMVREYIVPMPAKEPKEGIINMTEETSVYSYRDRGENEKLSGKIRGKLLIEVEKTK